jgi:hypothetical protein
LVFTAAVVLLSMPGVGGLVGVYLPFAVLAWRGWKPARVVVAVLGTAVAAVPLGIGLFSPAASGDPKSLFGLLALVDGVVVLLATAAGVILMFRPTARDYYASITKPEYD